MEYEVRFYYPLDSYKKEFEKLKSIKELNYEGRKHEITSQFNHPSKEYNFYSKEIDGRFRIRKTEENDKGICLISWKRRLKGDNLRQEEVELTIGLNEYDNLMFIVNNVLHMTLIETYERYRSVFKNDEVEIVLDEYPFGLALEIEAKTDENQEEVINKYLKLLDLKCEDSYKLSWDDKYEELCKNQNVTMYKEVVFGKEMPKIK